MKLSILAPVVLAGGTLAALVMPAAASASTAAPHIIPPGTTTAVTHLVDRPDSGGAGNWADDGISRVLTLRLTGGTPGAWTFAASVRDTGTFATIPFAFTPNQGPPFTGSHIRQLTHGSLQGEAQYSFTATELPSLAPNDGVPFFEAGAPSGDQTTSLWYEQAFPAGTVFGGPGILPSWSWSYNAQVRHVTVTYKFEWVLRHHHWVRVLVPVIFVQYQHQHWTDAAASDGGQLPFDGNILG
jgi:hypothetical protein